MAWEYVHFLTKKTFILTVVVFIRHDEKYKARLWKKKYNENNHTLRYTNINIPYMQYDKLYTYITIDQWSPNTAYWWDAILCMHFTVFNYFFHSHQWWGINCSFHWHQQWASFSSSETNNGVLFHPMTSTTRPNCVHWHQWLFLSQILTMGYKSFYWQQWWGTSHFTEINNGAQFHISRPYQT